MWDVLKLLRVSSPVLRMGQMSLCVVYGPHRSGKSYVASQLVRRHKALYLAGRMANEAIHVADMNRALEARFCSY